MYLEAVIERVWRSTWRPWLFELAGHNRATSNIHLEAVIKRVWRCTRRLWTRELGCCNCARLKIHLEAVIEQVWRCTWRPRRWELGGHDCASLEIQLEAVIERVWRCTWRPWSSEIGGVLGGGQSGHGSLVGRRNRSRNSIHWLPCILGNVENWVWHGLPRDERLAGGRRQSILGWCSTQCMQYSVYAELSVCCTRC